MSAVLRTALIALLVSGAYYLGTAEAARTFSAQFFMVMVVTAVSLMFLAAVIRERERAEAALRERLAFERLLSEVSAGFADRPVERIAEAIQGALARIVECLDVDRATLGQVSDDGRTLDLTYAADGHGIDPVPVQVRTSEFPWCGERILRGEAVWVSSLQDLPGEARVQLQQVILNLFMNAYEAMSGARDGPRELVVRTRGGPASVELLVSDTGPGLSDETVERMFEPFFTTKPKGLGLGLAISRTIVKAHGGEIRAVRPVDRGSTISVTLPTPP